MAAKAGLRLRFLIDLLEFPFQLRLVPGLRDTPRYDFLCQLVLAHGLASVDSQSGTDQRAHQRGQECRRLALDLTTPPTKRAGRVRAVRQ